MDFKTTLFFVGIFIAVKLSGQDYQAVIIELNNTNDSIYNVPTGFDLKLESIGYSCDILNHSDHIKINGKNVMLRQNIRELHYYNGTTSSSQSTWEIKMPFWLPEGTIISLNNHAQLQIYGLLVPHN